VTVCYLAALSSAAVAGDRFRLEVKERARLGSPESRRLRKQGFVPGVLYGKTTAQAFAVSERELRSALTGPSGLHAVLDVVLEGQTEMHPSILKEYQRDPIRGHVRHIDLQEVRLDVAIQATVQVHLHGAEDAPGVKEGGVLSQPSTTLNVEALPMEVPESIEADVSSMEMGDALRLEDLPALEGVTFLDDPHETVIATVSAPTVEAEPEPVEGEEGEEGEAVEGETAEGETAEGEAPAEGDAAESGSDSPE
jgi:large subunit ribosomal protein L25